MKIFARALADSALASLRLAWHLLNSNFGTALAGAAAGAVAGAFAAQVISIRIERRKQQASEIRAVNTATNLVVGTMNLFIGLKRQFVLPMAEALRATRERYDAHIAASQATRVQTPFRFDDEFQMLGPIDPPIDLLRDILFNKINADNFMLSVFQMLLQATKLTGDIIAQRNTLLEEFRVIPPDPAGEVLRLYLGLPRSDGPIDARYPMLVEHLSGRTNDAIFFAKVLAERLAQHAKDLAKDYGAGAPQVASPMFGRPEALGLIPDEQQYKELLDALRN